MANSSQTYLNVLQTPFGTRSVYDSVCYCNRCGMCVNVCPSYQQTQQEPFSPRGRNQILRQLISGKLKAKHNRKVLEEVIYSCALCGRCVQNCPGRIPTPQHVLELRRRTKISLFPRTLFYLLRLRQKSPTVFTVIVRGGLLLRRLGLLQLISHIPGVTWVKHALEILPSKITSPVCKEIKDPTLIYLPSLEAEFMMPALFEQTYKLAAKEHNVRVWRNTSSGLFEYAYGDLRRARKLLRGLITRHARTGNGKLPLLTDSMDVYNFLVSAPQLFAEFPAFEKKAVDFSASIRYVTDFFPKKLNKGKAASSSVQLFCATAFSQDVSLELKIRKILCTLFEKNFVECGYKQGIVPLSGYGFVISTHAPAYALSAVQGMAVSQTQSVFVTNGLTALELSFYVHKFYPAAQVRHIVELGDNYAKFPTREPINSRTKTQTSC